MSKPIPKKRVSFTQETKPETEEQPTTTQYPKKSLLLIPYHYILLLGSIFQYYNILDTVSEALLNSLIGLMVMQSMYGIVIIESTKKKSKKLNAGPSAIEYVLISLIILVCLVLSIPMNFLLVLFGAPISPNFNSKNFYLSSHLSLLSIFPIIVYNREDILKANWANLIKSLNQLSQVNCITLGGLLGCWLGVLPIPLDWDRDWQDWPITLLVGTYLFSFLGGVVGYIYNVIY